MLFRRASWLLPFLGLAGCQAPTKTAAPQTPTQTAPSTTSFAAPKDDLGRVIALKAPAKRVIVIEPGTIETIFALGAQKSLVGRGSFEGIPAAAKTLPIAGDYQGPSVEKSIALRPDLVILQGETWDRARVEQWQAQIGAPVAALTPTSVAGVRRDFLKIGSWLGRDTAAKKLSDSLKNAPILPPKAPTAFFEIGRSPLYAAGDGTLSADVMRAAGFRNVAADVKGYQPFGVESLIARAPDVYIAPSKKPRAEVLRELRADAALSKLSCVRKGAVIVVDGDWVLRPGPRLRLGIAALRTQ